MGEAATNGEVLVELRGLGARLEHLATEGRTLATSVQNLVLATERRLTALETDRERWFTQTWPSAVRVTEALEERVRALERTSLQQSALVEVRDKLAAQQAEEKRDREALDERLSVLERWRWRMVGMAAGLGLASSVVGWLAVRLIEKGAAHP